MRRATLVLRNDEMLDVPGLMAACDGAGITVLYLPTAYWHELAYALSTDVGRPSARAADGGHRRRGRPARARRALVPGGRRRVPLLNTYGPTEATVVATVASLSPYPGGDVPIGGCRCPACGPPSSTASCASWTRAGPRLPGQSGAHGPPLLHPGRLPAYRTGDLVSLREDGQLDYLARVDDEVKISGHRIHPAAVESVLLGHPGVREAAVVAQELPGGVKRLVAFVAAAGELTVAELRGHLTEQLPPPAVPGSIRLRLALPRTSTGKIDRALLRITQQAREHAAPTGAAVEELAPLPAEDRVPLSYAQRRLWFLSRLEGPSSTYNVPLVLRLAGVPQREALAAAIADVVERHEVLRTVFPSVDGEPYQRVLDDAGQVLTVLECAPQLADEQVAAFADESFDMAVDVPIRVRLFVLSPTESVLVLLVHHVATDGWSMGPLLRDLSAGYEARLGGAAPPWEPLPVQYADFTLWQHETLGDADDSASVLARQLDFWRSALAELPQVLELPTDRPRPAEPTNRGGTVSATLDAAVHRQLLAVGEEHRASLFMVLQAAFAAALAQVGAGKTSPSAPPWPAAPTRRCTT